MEKGPVFGLSIGELLTIYDHDSQSWKMSECLFTGDYAKYSAPLPKSGIMRNGKIYAQATWVHRTGGKESGLWRTPDTCAGGTKGKEFYEECKSTGKSAIRLQDQVRHEFPTPRANDAEKRGQIANDPRNGLPAAVKYPTPHSNCHTGPGKRGDGGENLQTAVNGLNAKSVENQAHDIRGNLSTGSVQIVGLFPTPRANKPEGYSSEGFRPTLAQIVTGEDKPLHGQLNPTWVDWLMGYPIGWTDCADSEMRLSLK